MSLENQFHYLLKSEKVYIYLYEWIDNIEVFRSAYFPYENCSQIMKNNLKLSGWDGTGILQEIYLPPFLVNSILDEPIDEGFDLTLGWKQGFVLWHIKQKTDGLSFIISLKKLQIPEFGLE